MPLRESIKNGLDHKTLGEVEMFEQMLHDLIHKSGGGICSLAGRMGYMGAAGEISLGNEVCPTNQQAKFGALELFVALVKVPKRDRERFMGNLDAMLGRDMVANHAVHYGSIMQGMAALSHELNEVNAAVFDSLADDGKLSQRERMFIAKETDDVIERAKALKESLFSGVRVNESA
ncbi:hypothetical protein THIOSC15_590007 [uncultured Thiomicrorhabdus sp.]